MTGLDYKKDRILEIAVINMSQPYFSSSYPYLSPIGAYN